LKKRRDPDLNREFLAEPVFETGAIPGYAITARQELTRYYLVKNVFKKEKLKEFS
jgi:hypothetical protein